VRTHESDIRPIAEICRPSGIAPFMLYCHPTEACHETSCNPDDLSFAGGIGGFRAVLDASVTPRRLLPDAQVLLP
jgi:hypothetical protein